MNLATLNQKVNEKYRYFLMYIPEPKINNLCPMLVHIIYHLLMPLKGEKQRTFFNYVFTTTKVGCNLLA